MLSRFSVEFCFSKNHFKIPKREGKDKLTESLSNNLYGNNKNASSSPNSNEVKLCEELRQVNETNFMLYLF